ncbi:hypothetical protein ACFOOM_31780 [Streptomyces echinoruber]|uniref:Uncharacterized protein n=1 Tax=Streptomyces echinoruber TaxID=68898 RepID=A0A918RTT1_9ACTN|nr:hypothetical protein [Streptomyces echinoruber]GHA10193.1 hypothetical protein GCM10010389_56760 [Streptomyces echinoruber]
MSDPIPLFLACVAFHLAALCLLLPLLRLPLWMPDRSAGVTPRRPPRATPPWPPARRPEKPLDGASSLLVRPYVVAAEQAARRAEPVPAELGFDGPGPYVIHGVEVA